MSDKKITQNGVTKPRAGGKMRFAWDTFDSVAESLNRAPTRAEALTEAEGLGIAKGTSATQYSHWKKFHGIKGRVIPPESDPTIAANIKPKASPSVVPKPPSNLPQSASNVIPMVAPANGASGYDHPGTSTPDELAQDTRLADEGWDAYCEGKEIKDCPYAEQSEDWHTWCEGWREASQS
jgi:ribosome modulation factor